METAEFEEKCRTHRRAVLAYAYACCRDLSLAEDIVQDAMVIASQKRESYFAEASFCGWLIAIARNVWFRRRGQRDATVPLNDAIMNSASLLFEQSRYSDDRWEIKQRVLETCVSKLQTVDQEVIECHFTRNMSYQQIATTMDKTLTWVKNRMWRARKALLDCMTLNLRRSEVVP